MIIMPLMIKVAHSFPHHLRFVMRAESEAILRRGVKRMEDEH